MVSGITFSLDQTSNRQRDGVLHALGVCDHFLVMDCFLIIPFTPVYLIIL